MNRTKPETRFQRADGTPTQRADPHRLLWYSTRCTYWTDDWPKLSSTGSRMMTLHGRSGPERVDTGGIPCCPECGAVGFQAEAGGWLASAKAHDEKHPGYYEWLLANKETCGPFPDKFKAKDGDQ